MTEPNPAAFPFHVILRWPARGADPEIILNIKGDELAVVTAHVHEGMERMAPAWTYRVETIMREEAQAAAAPAILDRLAPIAPATRPLPQNVHPIADPPVPVCKSETCERYGQPMGESRYGGLYCQGRDAGANGNDRGYCRSQEGAPRQRSARVR